MRIKPEIEEVIIVLIGDFNPAIFTPGWFALYDLLPRNAAANAELDIVHPEVTQFRADWLTLHVSKDKFNAGTLLAPHVRALDLVVRVFKEQLPHTPLRALGINRNVHFRVQDTDARDRIGRTLAPVEPWGAWGRHLGATGGQGGMTSLTMRQATIGGRPADDQINVAVEPSNRIVDASGVYVGVNDHYTAGETDGQESSKRLMDVLERNFEKSLACSENIVDHVMSLAEAQGGGS